VQTSDGGVRTSENPSETQTGNFDSEAPRAPATNVIELEPIRPGGTVRPADAAEYETRFAVYA